MQAAVINHRGSSEGPSLVSRVELAIVAGLVVAGIGIGALIAAPAGGTDAVRSDTAVDAASVPLAERVPSPGASEGRAP
jgi:hypothetical protein